jgi:glutathione synthase/RimK-type ligase-like ATP-grasp enzyme
MYRFRDHYRVFKRQSMNWKGNVGNMSILESIELTDEFRTWADECASLFGGIDILGLDFGSNLLLGFFFPPLVFFCSQC